MDSFVLPTQCPALPVGLFMASFILAPVILARVLPGDASAQGSKKKVARAVKPPVVAKLSDYFDHTLLKPEATIVQVDQLCAEAVRHDFGSVCVNSASTRPWL